MKARWSSPSRIAAIEAASHGRWPSLSRWPSEDQMAFVLGAARRLVDPGVRIRARGRNAAEVS